MHRNYKQCFCNFSPHKIFYCIYYSTTFVFAKNFDLSQKIYKCKTLFNVIRLKLFGVTLHQVKKVKHKWNWKAVVYCNMHVSLCLSDEGLC